MAEVDLRIVDKLAEDAEARSQIFKRKFEMRKKIAAECALNGEHASQLYWLESAQKCLNDAFYWSGKATSYRGIIAMVELQSVVEDELDAESSCP